MNYFHPKSVAERYSKGRPDFHGNAISLIKSFLNPDRKLSKALDIACGTGLSTKALLDIAENVYGTDISKEMLKLACRQDKIKYSIAPAENQPFSDNEFELITVCSGVHWFDIDKFLTETNRILKDNSWLVLYDNFFLSEMKDISEFSQWFPEVYLKKFPSPVRNSCYEWTNENLSRKKFVLREEKKFKNSVYFSKKELILYFTTQSNITASVENKNADYPEIEAWLDKELSQFFKTGERRTIHYGNRIKFIQRTGRL